MVLQANLNERPKGCQEQSDQAQHLNHSQESPKPTTYPDSEKTKKKSQ